ncbi:MAG: hypothetical protein ABFS45_14155 [Pseudomonadota bacterium]
MLEDLYPQADLVTFPSFYEDFKIPSLETIYYRVSVVVNRYSEFIRNIKPKGFHSPAIKGLINREVVRIQNYE